MSVLLLILGFIVFVYGLIKLIISAFKKSSKKKPGIIMIIGFVLFIVGSSTIKPSEETTKKETKIEKTESKPASESKKEEVKKESKPKQQEATQVTFEQLIHAYKENGTTADDNYKGKRLEFQGKVTKITKGTFGGSDVTVDAGNFTDNQFMDTSAVINMSDDSAKKIVSEQTYTFQAKLTRASVMDSGWVSRIDFSKGEVK